MLDMYKYNLKFKILKKIEKICGKILCDFFLIFNKNKKMNVDVLESYKKLNMLSPNPNMSCYTQNIIGEEYDLDIIVPAYNVEKYIRECIDSVLKQRTKYQYRIIVINDGSNDKTGDILREYSKENKVIIVYQENKGFSGARNTGIRMINSKYIMFLDADDYLAPNAIQSLLDCAYQNDAEIVEGGYCTVYETGKIKNNFGGKDGKLNPLSDLRGQPWGKVIKSRVFQHICYPENFWYEDSIFRQIIYPQLKNCYGEKAIVYFYRINTQGISITGINNPKCIDSLWIYLSLYEDGTKFAIPHDIDYYEYTLLTIKLTFRRTCKMKLEIKKAIFDVFSDFVQKNWEGFSSKNVENRKLEYALRNNNFWMYYFTQLLY